MRVVIAGKTHNISDKDLLGEGGEAKVYAFGSDKAIKIYHQDGSAAGSTTMAGHMATATEKLRKVAAFPKTLPASVVGPMELVYGSSGQAIGFTMMKLPKATDVRELSSRKFRDGVYTNAQVTELFRTMYDVVQSLHKSKAVIGDFNSSNVMFSTNAGSLVPWFIDADSMQFGGFPCVVAHEHFLAPELYGADLSKGLLSTDTDWYAYSVMLFMSLLYVHPYGGLHPKYPTLLRRAEAHHSLLNADVKLPKSTSHYRILSDDLLHWFSLVFDQTKRGEFPVETLAVPWVQCSCGATHARRVCPECSAAVQVPKAQPVVHQGKCRARVLFETKGRILTSSTIGGLKYLYHDAGELRRERDELLKAKWVLLPDAVYTLSGNYSCVGTGSWVFKLGQGSPTKTGCGLVGNRPMFDTNHKGQTFYTWNDSLMCDGSHWGQILENHTWFRVGENFGLGFYRVGNKTRYFAFSTKLPGLRYFEGLPDLKGRVLEAACSFDDDRVWFEATAEYNGKTRTHYAMVKADGSVVAQGSMDSVAHTEDYGSLGGKIVKGRLVFCAIDRGLISYNVDGSFVNAGKVYTDTEPFVSAGDTLHIGLGGSIYAVSNHKITELTLS